MKTLLLLRHAKSSWKDDGLDDHDRPLNKRGKRDAPKMGQLIREKRLVPEMIVSSSARRARKTAAKVHEACGCRRAIELSDALYMAEPGAYLSVLRSLDREYRRVLVVGHNPGLEHLVKLLTERDEALPTAALVVIELSIKSWSSLSKRTRGRLRKIYRPKDLQDLE